MQIRRWAQLEILCTKDSRIANLSHLTRTSAWQVSSVQGGANLDDNRKLGAKKLLHLSSNESEAHLSLAVETWPTENPRKKLLPEFKSSSRDAARLKWDASNSSWSPLPLPSRTKGLNQWQWSTTNKCSKKPTSQVDTSSYY